MFPRMREPNSKIGGVLGAVGGDDTYSGKLAANSRLPFLPVCMLLQRWKQKQKFAEYLVARLLQCFARRGLQSHISFSVMHSSTNSRMHNTVEVGKKVER